MSPVSFIKRPVLWIEALCQYRATITGAPNFGLQLASRKWLEELNRGRGRALDLSSLRLVGNAAEPITVAAMRDFVEAFAPLGLQPQVRLGFR